MKATLCIDDLEFDLGHDALQAALTEILTGEGSGAYRGKAWQRLLVRLADDPDPYLRAGLAEIMELPLAVGRKLADDGDTLVITALVESGNSLDWITAQQVRRFLATPDTNLHLALVHNIHNFSTICRHHIASELCHSPATAVRRALAESSFVPREALEDLGNDDDGDVRELAATTLAQLGASDGWGEDDDNTW